MSQTKLDLQVTLSMEVEREENQNEEQDSQKTQDDAQVTSPNGAVMPVRVEKQEQRYTPSLCGVVLLVTADVCLLWSALPPRQLNSEVNPSPLCYQKPYLPSFMQGCPKATTPTPCPAETQQHTLHPNWRNCGQS